MMIFYKLRVKEIIRETVDTVSIEFDVPPDLEQFFAYLPGQYLTIKCLINGVEHRRSYSICSAPFVSKELTVAVKHVKGGLVSGFINTGLKVGDEIEVMPPAGRFVVDVAKSNEKDYVLFAGGSGITPIISIIKSILNVEPKSRIVLFYGNSDTRSIIFRNQLDLLFSKYRNFKLHYVVENPNDELESFLTGRMTKDKIEVMLLNHVNLMVNNEYFICGPEIMMKNVRDVLDKNNIPKNSIRLEYFSPLSVLVDVVEEVVHILEEGTAIKIIIGGIETDLLHKDKKEPLLETALKAGLDIPYSCKEAICCSCKAKVTQGKVKMKQNYSLLDDEVDEGYVLTCQSYPVAGPIVINYDI